MRRLGWAVVFAVLVSGFAPSAAAVTTDELDAQAELFDLINDFRTAKSRAAVSGNPFIDGVAYSHSSKMARVGSISHDGFSKRFSTVKANVPGVSTMCENVAFVSGVSGPDAAARRLFGGWKRSRPHKRCMLAGFADEAGVGVRKRGSRWYATYIAVD